MKNTSYKIIVQVYSFTRQCKLIKEIQILYFCSLKVNRLQSRLSNLILDLKIKLGMNDKKVSLMERRNRNLGGLQTTIKALSVVEKQIKAPNRHILQHFHSADLIESSNPRTPTEIPDNYEKLTEFTTKDSLQPPSSDQEDHGNEFDQRYKVEEKLGEGAHGVVHKCINSTTGKAFAVKTLQTEDEHLQSIKTNFINIKQLNHESVIGYKALFIEPKQRICRTVMEYFPHPPLRQGLTEDQLRTVFYKLFDALSYLHKKYICHRDIKPDNILYDKTTQRIRIIDFGVSKNMKRRGRYEEMLTNTGTYYYKAPEMFLGAGYTQAVDIWAAGISLYELITGTTPFASVYHSETINNIHRQDLDLNREQFNKLNPLLKDLLTRLLKRNPKERISSEEAKKHLWFFPNISSEEMLKSANQHKNTHKESEKKGLTSFVVKRKASLLEDLRVEKEVTKTEKKVMNSWLMMINEDTTSYQTQNVTIEFFESEDEDEDFKFHLPQQSSHKVHRTAGNSSNRTISN